MSFRIITSVLLGGAIIISLMAFQNTDAEGQIIQAMIDEAVEKRVEEYRRIRILKCYERILKVADQKADSIILKLAREDFRIDTVPRPQTPLRPERPVIKPPRDTTPVMPFLPVDSTKH